MKEARAAPREITHLHYRPKQHLHVARRVNFVVVGLPLPQSLALQAFARSCMEVEARLVVARRQHC